MNFSRCESEDKPPETQGYCLGLGYALQEGTKTCLSAFNILKKTVVRRFKLSRRVGGSFPCSTDLIAVIYNIQT